jgi:hypothetical protein
MPHKHPRIVQSQYNAMLILRLYGPFHQRLLRVNAVLLPSNAAKPLLQRVAHARAAAPDARCVRFWLEGVLRRHGAGGVYVADGLAVAAGCHLDSAVAEPLVVLQLLFDGVGRLALALQIIGVVELSTVSFAGPGMVVLCDLRRQELACSLPCSEGRVACRFPPRSRRHGRTYPPCPAGQWRRPPMDGVC